MMKRRDYGSGSVYKRKDGRWVGAYSHGWTERGTRRRVTVTADTQAEAKRRLRKKVQEIEAGTGTEASAKTTVRTWAMEWLGIVERQLAPNSLNATRSGVNRWIVPTIGHRRIGDLTPFDIRAVADAQRKAGKSSSTQRRTHSVLMQLLKAAQLEGLPVPVRILAVKAPEPAVSDRTDIPATHAAQMLAHAAEDPSAGRWVVAFLQGLRQGEALGLTRDAVDLERGILTVSWQLQPLPYRIARDRSSGFRVPDGYEARQVRGRWHLVRPKSSAGWREIPLVPWAAAALRRRLDEAPDAPHGLLWHYPKGDPPKLDDAAWYELQDAVGVRHPTRLNEDGQPAHYTIHEARHTTATILRELRVDRAVIAAILGQVKLVESYVHADLSPQAVHALEQMAERLAISPAVAAGVE